MHAWFSRVSGRTSLLAGHPITTGCAFLLVIAWTLGGLVVGFTDTYQLLINTGTTIVTFLMVFLIQNAANRSGEAMQLKLDEVIRALEGARDELIAAEDKSINEIRQMKAQEFQQ